LNAKKPWQKQNLPIFFLFASIVWILFANFVSFLIVLF
jgi:hypothetical protein